MNTILLVEDEPIIRKAKAKMLAKVDREVIVAVDGFDALDKIAIRAFDLVISDISMPHLSGIELLKTLRASGNDLKFMFVSAFNPAEYAKEIEALCVLGCLRKPFQRAALETLVLQILDPATPAQ